MEFWDSATGQARFFARAGTNGFNRLTFSPDGTQLAFGNDLRGHLWNPAEGRELRTIEFARPGQPASALMHVVFSFDGRFLMAGFFDGSIRVFRLADGRETVLRGHGHQVRGLVLLHDGRTLLSSAGELRVWDLETGQELRQLAPCTWSLCLALSPDGRRLVSVPMTGALVLWDTASWQEVVTLEGHEDRVYQLAFSADGGPSSPPAANACVSSGQTQQPSASLSTRIHKQPTHELYEATDRGDGPRSPHVTWKGESG